MKEGATAEVIENHPMAKANVARSLTKYARRQAGTDRSGPSRRNGVRTRTRSDIQPRTTVAIPAAREKRAKSKPRAREALVKRKAPRGVAADVRPSTPPWPENARAVLRPTRRKSREKERVSSAWARLRTRGKFTPTMTAARAKTARQVTTAAKDP